MTYRIICLIAFLWLAFPALAQPTTPDKLKPVNQKNIQKSLLSWRDTAVQYKVIFKGTIGIGRDGLRSEDSELQVNVVMSNGLVVPLKNNGSGAITNADDPANRVFNLHIWGESSYVTSLQVSFVEVIHLRKPLTTGSVRNIDILRYDNFSPDEWDFLNIQLSGKITRRDSRSGTETTIEQGEVLNRALMRKMSFGIWASAAPPAYFTPPGQIQEANGRVAARVLTGADDMKKDPENAAILVQVPSGTLQYKLGRIVGLAPFGFQNYDALAKMEGTVPWKSVGKAGIVFKYGDHGLFDRDDWIVKALLVDFFPDMLRSKGICFRKASHYIHNNNSAYLVKLNGDGNGTEVWAPFY